MEHTFQLDGVNYAVCFAFVLEIYLFICLFSINIEVIGDLKSEQRTDQNKVILMEFISRIEILDQASENSFILSDSCHARRTKGHRIEGSLSVAV